MPPARKVVAGDTLSNALYILGAYKSQDEARNAIARGSVRVNGETIQTLGHELWYGWYEVQCGDRRYELCIEDKTPDRVERKLTWE